MSSDLDQLCIDTIRTLSIDAVQQAKSGHPGTPMALAPLVYTLWNRVLRFDPRDPIWPNRDRFVLSNGHASMLLWSVLHLSQTQAVNAEYERLGQPSVSLDDIRRFRQLGSKAPGHPEYRWVSGVETTSGPLGQGVATSVGMAIAQKWLAHRYRELFEKQPIDYREAVLPPAVTARVAVEQASTFGWERYVGTTGRVIGMRTFGASAPLKALQQKYGFEPREIVAAAKAQLAAK